MKVGIKARTLSLVLVGAVAGAVLISPVAAGPTDPASKRFARQIAHRAAKNYFNKNMHAWIKRFFFQAAPNTTDAVIGTFGTLTLKATCDAAGDPTLRASWSETVDQMTLQGSGQSGNATVDPGTTIDIGSGAQGGSERNSGDGGTIGHAEAVAFSSKAHTSIEYFLRDAPALGENKCFYSGYVTLEIPHGPREICCRD